MPVLLETFDTLVERYVEMFTHDVSLIPPVGYNIGIGGVKMAFRPTEPRRRHGQNHVGDG